MDELNISASPESDDAERSWRERGARHGLDILEALARARPLKLRPQRFVFLRHGETQGNHLRILQHPEIELNATGVAQASRAAALIAQAGVERIVASDVRRAWQTVEIVSRALGIDAVAEERLRERRFGDLIGTSSVNLHWGVDPANGESLHAFVERTQAGLEAALESDAPTLLVSHGGILYVLAYSLGLRLREELVRNATPLVFEPDGAAWRMLRLGSTEPPSRSANIGW